MSRTDKTDPYWLTATHWEPWHHYCQHDWLRRGERDCDLPADPGPPRHPERPHLFRRRRCTWQPEYVWTLRHPRARDVRIYYTGPARRRARDELTLARAQHRATGEVDVIANVDQHRHAALWERN
jgi:hypothetical protein